MDQTTSDTVLEELGGRSAVMPQPYGTRAQGLDLYNLVVSVPPPSRNSET